MKFICDVTPGNGAKVIVAVNPITKTEVQFNPPFVWETHDQLEAFAANFELYCHVVWHFSRADPTEIDVSRWPKIPPPWVLKLIETNEPQVISESRTAQQPARSNRPNTQ